MKQLTAILVLLGLTACDPTFSPPTKGILVGSVDYVGSEYNNLENPTVLVTVISTLTSATPHGVAVLSDADFSNGPIEFEIVGLRPYDYYLAAQMGEPETVSDGGGPTGGYPDFCSLTRLPSGNVNIEAGEVLDGVNLTIYDNAGLADPCTEPNTDACPAMGEGSVIINLESMNVTPQPEDVLVFAFFKVENPMLGVTDMADLAFFDLVTGNNITFPFQYIDNSIIQLDDGNGNLVIPPDYSVVICYDVNGDNYADVDCGAEDTLVIIQNGELISFPADTVRETTVNLDTGTDSSFTQFDPSQIGC